MSPSESRARWINADTEFLVGLASQIAGDETLRCIASSDRFVLQNFQGDVQLELPETTESSLQLTAEESKAETSSDATSDHVDALSSLFRSRLLLYESSIAADLFPQVDEAKFDLISPYAVRTKAAELAEQERVRKDDANKTQVRNEDEDYDDDEEEEEDDGHGNNAMSISKVSANGVNGQSSSKNAGNLETISKTNGVHAKTETKESQRNGLQDRKNEDAILTFDLNSTFHTLEYDRHALLEQNTLDASDRQVEEESAPVEKERLSSINFGAANLSLKHLISKIDQSRERLAMSDNELRNLLSEVRKNRSKWANEDKVGQEELYEAAERVVLELRGYTEHSTAFLNKVTKRDVPDYYNFIKEPMDLGTLMKNLKNLQYKSKAEFSKDVMLIWDNCLRYNADAAHPLRKHAYAMRRKSEQLLAMVPDVVVRDRADVEAEEFGITEGDQDYEDEEDRPLASKSTRGTFGPKSTKTKKPKNAADELHVEANGNTDQSANGLKQEGMDREPSHSPERLTQGDKTLPTDASDAANDPEKANARDASDVDEVEEANIDFQIWRTRTKKTRARYVSVRHKRLRQDVIRPDEIALVLTPQLLARPETDQIPESNGSKAYSDSAYQHSRAFIATRDANEVVEEMVLNDYEACSVPIAPATTDLHLTNDTSMRVTDVSRFEPREDGLYRKMRDTALEMKGIRRLCTKLSTLKLMQDPTMSAFPASYFRQLMEADTQLTFEPLELKQAGLDIDPCGEELARALMRRSSSHLLYQAGFEDFQPQAIDAFAEIAGDFLTTIGKVMKEYTESPKQLTEEQALRHTLFEVGIPDLNALGDYVVEEVVSRSDKVVALHDRLKKFLNDFIHGNVDGESTGDQDLFDEKNRDAFVAGSFGDETGEDFFGFRELGLEKEFGMSSLSIPLRLLQGRLRPTSGTTALGDGDILSTLRFDRRFPHITKRLASQQIGIFRTFLESKFAQLVEHEGGGSGDEDDEGDGEGDGENGTAYLPEDEDLPMRQRKPKPRLGPTGKITSAMKRPIKEPHISPKKKKKTSTSADRNEEAASPTATLS